MVCCSLNRELAHVYQWFKLGWARWHGWKWLKYSIAAKVRRYFLWNSVQKCRLYAADITHCSWITLHALTLFISPCGYVNDRPPTRSPFRFPFELIDTMKSQFITAVRYLVAAWDLSRLKKWCRGVKFCLAHETILTWIRSIQSRTKRRKTFGTRRRSYSK